MDAKTEFLEIYNKYINRDGSAELLKWLNTTDFFIAPASTKYHSAFEGGLVEHSVKVYHRFVKLVKNEYGEEYSKVISDESLAIIGLLHDLCKVNCYKTEFRNVKDENGNWTKQPFFTYSDDMPYGHGEKSVYIINGFLRLTREEAMAINWHMGGFDARVKNGASVLSDAFYMYPIAALFNAADTLTTYLDEKR